MLVVDRHVNLLLYAHKKKNSSPLCRIVSVSEFFYANRIVFTRVRGFSLSPNLHAHPLTSLIDCRSSFISHSRFFFQNSLCNGVVTAQPHSRRSLINGYHSRRPNVIHWNATERGPTDLFRAVVKLLIGVRICRRLSRCYLRGEALQLRDRPARNE